MKKITFAKKSFFAASLLAISAGILGCSKNNGSVSANTKEILVVSFGTSYNNSRSITIGGIESSIKEAFPDYNVERAFTADTIINILNERDGIKIDNVNQALDKAIAKGVKTLVVQPTHLMSGFEYTDLKNTLDTYKGKFEKIVLSKPLLTDDSDYTAVAKAITNRTAKYDDGKTAICFMGHGTEADSNSDYAKMQEVLTSMGFENYYVGTVEAAPSVDDLITAISKKGGYERIVLKPLMVVAGDHANNDMAGDDDDSWKNTFLSAGYKTVVSILEGLGQDNEIQQIYVDHVKEAISTL